MSEEEGIIVKAFHGFRPPREIDVKVASPPYDVLNTKEAIEMAKGNQYSFLNVNKPEICLPEGTDPYSDEVYEKGRDNLHLWIQNKWLIKDKQPSFYVYSQKMGDHQQYGLCCTVSVEQYAKGLIKKHENTTKAKELDRTKLTKCQKANVGPVFLTYKQQANIDEIINSVISQPPDHDFKSLDDVQHVVWAISDPEIIKKLKEEFLKVKELYVADGHHRCASAYNVGKQLKEEAIASGKPVSDDDEFNFFFGGFIS